MIYSIGSIGEDVFHWLPMIFKNIPGHVNQNKIISLAAIIEKINPLAYKLYFHWPHDFVTVGTSHL